MGIAIATISETATSYPKYNLKCTRCTAQKGVQQPAFPDGGKGGQGGISKVGNIIIGFLEAGATQSHEVVAGGGEPVRWGLGG